MATTVHFRDEDQQLADFIKEHGDFENRTEAVRASLKTMKQLLQKRLLKEKYSRQEPVDEEVERLSGESWDDLGEY